MLRFKRFRCASVMLATFIMIIIMTVVFTRRFASDCWSQMNILLTNKSLVNINNQLNKILLDGTPMPDPHVQNNPTDRATSIAPPLNEPSLYHDYALTLERRTSCNLEKPNNCFGTKKSLVITFWSQRSGQLWFAQNLLSVFPESYFDYVVMIHDNSSWNHHPAYNKAIWIHVASQLKFWYIKRFLSPHVLQAYRYVWVVDDDVRFYFNPRVYECVADEYNISLSAPARGEGVTVHTITKLLPQFTSRIGRWTDHVEIGPIFIAKAPVWVCLWKLLSEKVGLGYGLDGIWCKLLSDRCFRQHSYSKICAVLDAFVVHHDATTINNVIMGLAERPAYSEYYMDYSSGKRIFEPVAPNSSHLNLCKSKLLKAWHMRL